ncbi:methyltransferase domain-containing protein [Candidatus Aalborgicola defluviihabitans]|uniref:methyltransferase domain-containing protein n=1 Tax=Candidatus Aalborgicola defluviihabitans TaxID=3386187 RepID=UPI001DA11C15|nr:class I SAM-dependent methyltransferase [Burkholderiales bacterium]
MVKHFLDVGCGYGFFSKAAQSRGYQVTSIELAKTERAIATQMLGVQPIASSFEAFSGESGKFSVVLMSQILEHALDFNDWIVKAKGLLKENGHLVIALPNFGSIFRYLMQEREPYICPPAHINFFNTRSLSVLLQKHGFQVVERQWITRIPKSALRSRFGDLMGTSLVPFSKIAASAIDSSHLGMMINIYAQKV